MAFNVHLTNLSNAAWVTDIYMFITTGLVFVYFTLVSSLFVDCSFPIFPPAETYRHSFRSDSAKRQSDKELKGKELCYICIDNQQWFASLQSENFKVITNYHSNILPCYTSASQIRNVLLRKTKYEDCHSVRDAPVPLCM